MSNKLKVILLLALLATAIVVFWPHQDDAAITGERTRDQLELREGDVLFVKETNEIFNGLLVEYYPDKVKKVAIEVTEGKPHGVSRGWYDNGQQEVEEHFVKGLSHGKRTRWYDNGTKKSEAEIDNGKIVGTFIKWHENGQKAAEAKMVDGKPDGLSQAWHPSGELKSQVTLKAGEIVSKEYWEDDA